MTRLLTAIFALLVFLSPADAQVREIVAPGAIPGSLTVFSKKATIYVTTREGNIRVPLVASAPLGKGTVLALAHEGLVAAAATHSENAEFLQETMRSLKPGVPRFRIAVLDSAMRPAFTVTGATVIPVSLPRMELSGVDFLYLDQAALDTRISAVSDVQKWVKSGGIVILAGPLWGWRAVTGKNPLTQHSGNQIAREAGIVFADGMTDMTGKAGWLLDSAGTTYIYTPDALNALSDHAAGVKTLTRSELTQATVILQHSLESLSPSGSPLERDTVKRINALCDRYASDAIPTKTAPVTASMPFARLKLIREIRDAQSVAPEKVKASPAAAAFPGSVPAEAPRLTQTITINPRIPEWHGTGLYAPPGEVVTITLPDEASGKGIAVRIGSHTDTLWHLDKWLRAPEISLRREISGKTLRLASPFGGAIFVDIPATLSDVAKAAMPGKGILVKIAGAVAAPRFVRGVTGQDDWKKSIRNALAPWAELEGKRIILSVPSYAVRELDDPEALMAYWDEVADLCADLYAIPRERARPERYCVDVQISAGYMHSGYPIMTYDDVARTFTNLAVLRGPDGHKTWGFYHELGHNHQQSDWTFDGTGEVTNNLFSLYGGERLNNADQGGDYLHSHPAVTPVERRKRLSKYLASGAKFSDWQGDPFLALTMYIQLRRTFGWEPFQKVFAEYNALPAAERPKNEMEKRSQWMLRFSRAVGKNLGPFFDAWGVPVSEAVKKEVVSLPVWMPDDLPIR